MVIAKMIQVPKERKRVLSANKCSHGFWNHINSRKIKMALYVILLRPAVIYVPETLTLTKADERALDLFERMILRSISRAPQDRGQWRGRKNFESHKLHDESDTD
jgi:hypothetical protein